MPPKRKAPSTSTTKSTKKSKQTTASSAFTKKRNEIAGAIYARHYRSLKDPTQGTYDKEDAAKIAAHIATRHSNKG